MSEQRARDGGIVARASPNERAQEREREREREREGGREERRRVLRAPVRESHSTHHRKADCERRMQRGMLAMPLE